MTILNIIRWRRTPNGSDAESWIPYYLFCSVFLIWSSQSSTIYFGCPLNESFIRVETVQFEMIKIHHPESSVRKRMIAGGRAKKRMTLNHNLQALHRNIIICVRNAHLSSSTLLLHFNKDKIFFTFKRLTSVWLVPTNLACKCSSWLLMLKSITDL